MIENNFKIDFVGIGAPKCATTWIYECLKEHPQIWMSPKDRKEFSYFFLSSENSLDSKKYKYFLKTWKSGQLRGDFNNAYIITSGIAERIKNHNPDIKILVSLRNPVSRAYSHYLHRYSLTKKDWKPFFQAVKNPEDRRAIIEFGFYGKLLQKFFDKFKRENILVLVCENIKKDPLKFIRKVYKFLGVDHSFEPQRAKMNINVTLFKLTKLGNFVHKSITPALKKSLIGWKIHQSPIIRKVFYYFAKWYSPEEKSHNIDDKTQNYLKKVYRKDIEKLEKLIQRDLSIWKK